MLEIALSMFVCLVLTAAIECLLAALIFKVRRKREILVVLAAQLLTNPFVVGISCVVVPTAIAGAGTGEPLASTLGYTVLWISEAAAFVVEGFVYKSFKFERPFLMSFVLNACSLLVGVALEAAGWL